MQSNSRMFEDAAKLAGGALGAMAGLRREVEALVQQQLERLLVRMDLVTRDEFETVKALAVLAREENEKLSARLDALEAAAGSDGPKTKTKTRKRGKPSSASAKD
jgi:BMFP domain-containing protein YqiC